MGAVPPSALRLSPELQELAVDEQRTGLRQRLSGSTADVLRG